MKIVFEDNRLSPFSLILSEIFGNNVVFSNGNKNFPNKIREFINEGVICIVDCPVSNKDTKILVNNLETEFRKYNVIIVPIQCIELYVLIFLYAQGVLNCEHDYKERFIMTILSDSKKVQMTEDSYETFCKSVLNSTLKICMRNTNESKNKLYGKFWKEGCTCELPYSKKCKYISYNSIVNIIRNILPVRLTENSVIIDWESLIGIRDIIIKNTEWV